VETHTHDDDLRAREGFLIVRVGVVERVHMFL